MFKSQKKPITNGDNQAGINHVWDFFSIYIPNYIMSYIPTGRLS